MDKDFASKFKLAKGTTLLLICVKSTINRAETEFLKLSKICQAGPCDQNFYLRKIVPLKNRIE